MSPVKHRNPIDCGYTSAPQTKAPTQHTRQPRITQRQWVLGDTDCGAAWSIDNLAPVRNVPWLQVWLTHLSNPLPPTADPVVRRVGSARGHRQHRLCPEARRQPHLRAAHLAHINHCNCAPSNPWQTTPPSAPPPSLSRSSRRPHVRPTPPPLGVPYSPQLRARTCDGRYCSGRGQKAAWFRLNGLVLKPGRFAAESVTLTRPAGTLSHRMGEGGFIRGHGTLGVRPALVALARAGLCPGLSYDAPSALLGCCARTCDGRSCARTCGGRCCARTCGGRYRGGREGDEPKISCPGLRCQAWRGGAGKGGAGCLTPVGEAL